MSAIPVPTVRDFTAPSGRRVFTANVRAEWTKLRSVRSTTWTLLATVGIAAATATRTASLAGEVAVPPATGRSGTLTSR